MSVIKHSAAAIYLSKAHRKYRINRAWALRDKI